MKSFYNFDKNTILRIDAHLKEASRASIEANCNWLTPNLFSNIGLLLTEPTGIFNPHIRKSQTTPSILLSTRKLLRSANLVLLSWFEWYSSGTAEVELPQLAFLGLPVGLLFAICKQVGVQVGKAL